MARKGITIPVASDTRAFSKGIDSGVIDPLEDVATVLEDVAREGDRAGEQLEDAMRDAQRETEQLKDAHKELNDAIVKGSKTAYKKMAQEADENMEKAERSIDGVKDEGKAAFGEMAGSFDGSMDSMVGSAQGFLGGLVASGGPIAMAAGGIGILAGSFYNMWKENSEKTSAAVSEMYEDMKESGKGFLSAQFILGEADKIISDADGAVIKHKDAMNQAEALGMSVQDLILAYAGDAEAREKVVTATRDMYEADTKYMNTAEALATENAKVTGETTKRMGAAESLLKIMDEQAEKEDSAINKAKTYTEVLRVHKNQYEKTYDTALQKQGEAIDSLGRLKSAAEKVPHEVPVTLKPNTKELDNTIRKLEKNKVQITAEFKERYGRRIS